MSEKINLKAIEQKTYNELMKDGITEILIGVILIFCPIFYIAPFLVVFYFIPIFFGNKIMIFIRERTTYPRIGRVELRMEEEKEDYSIKKTILVFFLFLVIVISITLSIMFIVEEEIQDLSILYKWVPFGFGLIMFGPSLYLIDKTGQKSYYLLGFFSAVLGLIFSLVVFSDAKFGLFLYFIVFGILILVLGILRFAWFVRIYPVIPIEEE